MGTWEICIFRRQVRDRIGWYCLVSTTTVIRERPTSNWVLEATPPMDKSIYFKKPEARFKSFVLLEILGRRNTMVVFRREYLATKLTSPALFCCALSWCPWARALNPSPQRPVSCWNWYVAWPALKNDCRDTNFNVSTRGINLPWTLMAMKKAQPAADSDVEHHMPTARWAIHRMLSLQRRYAARCCTHFHDFNAVFLA